MTTATLNVKMSPRRMLSQREAAEYVGVPLKRFPALAISPVQIAKDVVVYDLHDLDAFVDNVKSGAVDSDDAIVGRL